MAQEAAADSKTQHAIEAVLSQIIDEWYERVAPHYLTSDGQEGPGGSRQEAELKRFHDERGHRIKFNKGNLDFTYGLRSYWEGDGFVIEISVNNKVEGFHYDDFRVRLLHHYAKTSAENVPTPYSLKAYSYGQVFQLEPSREESFSVERHESRADIMRLAFQVTEGMIRTLASHPVASKQLIEDYCVSPFRRIYAAVYRSQRK